MIRVQPEYLVCGALLAMFLMLSAGFMAGVVTNEMHNSCSAVSHESGRPG
jgi:hypothetical protein